MLKKETVKGNYISFIFLSSLQELLYLVYKETTLALFFFPVYISLLIFSFPILCSSRHMLNRVNNLLAITGAL